MNRLTDTQQLNSRSASGRIADGRRDRHEAHGCVDAQVPIATTLLERLHWRASHQPERVAYQFLADQPATVAHSALEVWNYRELYAQTKRVASSLIQQFEGHRFKGSPLGQSVLLVYPPGLPLIAAFLGCLAVGAIAIPVPPPRRHESLARWQHIIADANISGILTTPALKGDITALVQSVKSQKMPSEHMPSDLWIRADTLAGSDSGNKHGENKQPKDLHKRFPSAEKIAFLQYTSGSTSQPKGVMVTHANLAHNLQQIQQAFGHSAETRCVIWLPPYHDMGLIGGILQPLYGGYPVTLMSPTSFLRQPFRWLDAISYFGATTSGGPNFAYDYCVQKISAEQKKMLNLETWTVAFTGAEPVRSQTLDRFTESFSGCGFRRRAFYPCYGLAESTLFVSGGDCSASPKIVELSKSALANGKAKVASDEGDAASFVSCGSSFDQHIEIVDPHTRLACLPEQVGEIWIAGDSVAAGYWGNVKATEESFKAKLVGQIAIEQENLSFLRTGDLGFVTEKELFITGRLKDLIVIRGQNYYPQDIELSASEAHSALQAGCAAFGVSTEGEAEQLVVVQEVSRKAVRSLRKQTLQVAEIVEAIRAAVSKEHGLKVGQVALLRPGHLPKTTSGKVQRQTCKAQFQSGTLACVGQWPEATEEVTHSFETIPAREDPPFVTESSSLNQQTVKGEKESKETRKANELLAWLRDYARDSVNSRQMDEQRCLSPGIILDFGNKGLLGMQVPQQYGGLGLGNRSMLQIIQQLGAIDPTLALFVGLNNVLGIRPILHFATPALKEQLLPKLATGRELAAFAITEAGAGSHPFGITATAKPAADGWQLQGEKIWSGSAAWAGVINVFVQQVDGAGNPLGISGFAVQKGTAGLKQGPEALTMGMRGMVQNAVWLEQVPVNQAQMLGAAGQGMAVAQDAMMYGRLAIASACVGGMKRCAQLMLRYGKRRQVSTGRLLDNPVTRTRLSWLTNAIAAVESLVTLMATRLDSDLPVPEELYAACKITAPEFYWQAADYLMQCLGGRGYIETNLAPQIMRDARVLRIFEGPTESLSMYLGSRVVNQRKSLRAFFEAIAVLEVGELLFEAADWVLESYLNEESPFSEELSAKRQANYVVGELAGWAILLAALKATDAPVGAIAWCQNSLDQAITKTLRINPDESAILSTTDTDHHITQYQQSIGEIDQTQPGADETTDELLKPESKNSQKPHEKTKVSTVHISELKTVERDQSVAKQERTLVNWMTQWLSRQLAVKANKIEPTKAFAEYGLDSVMAVELAQDLSAFLQLAEPLEVTLAWNFPTIQALASHLADISNVRSSLAEELIPDTDDEETFPEPILGYNNFSEDLSDDEVADALAAELATVRGR
ncbi:MAG: AMP-binding protein [Cyanobacteria bacterium J06634_6]